MTTFINPLEALGLDPLVRPDASSVKRARRRMLVEVELADGPVNLGDATVSDSRN